MRLNSKLTWGLAWTGLAVVVAVPSADFLTGQFGARAGSAAVIGTTGALAVPPAVTRTAAVTTTVTKTGVTITPAGSAAIAAPADAVDKLLKGKPLPDYISDYSAPVAAGKAPAGPLAATQVANVAPAAVAPIPFPQRPPDLARPLQPKAIAPQPTVIVDETALLPRNDAPPDQIAVNDGPVPPVGIPDDGAVGDRKLQRYLERNGLVDAGAPDGRSSASVTIVGRPSPTYDPDGFYLSDGPNESRAARRARIERMLEDDEDSDPGFTLF